MKERIKKYIDYKSVSPGKLAEMLDVQRSSISHILNGRNKPGALFLERLLLSFPDLNARWLLTGNGNMINQPEKRPSDMTENGGSGNKKGGKTAQKGEATGDQPQTSNGVESRRKNTPEKERSAPSPEKEKSIEKVILLYSDGTFSFYRAEGDVPG